MKVHGYRNQKFGVYEVSRSGAVYTRRKNESLKRIKGGEARKVRRALADKIDMQLAVMRAKKTGGTE